MSDPTGRLSQKKPSTYAPADATRSTDAQRAIRDEKKAPVTPAEGYAHQHTLDQQGKVTWDAWKGDPLNLGLDATTKTATDRQALDEAIKRRTQGGH